MVLVFTFGYHKCHFWARKNGHFWQKCPYSGTEKWHFGRHNKKTKTTFTLPPKYESKGLHPSLGSNLNQNESRYLTQQHSFSDSYQMPTIASYKSYFISESSSVSRHKISDKRRYNQEIGNSFKWMPWGIQSQNHAVFWTCSADMLKS